jgi:hypothetical protein
LDYASGNYRNPGGGGGGNLVPITPNVKTVALLKELIAQKNASAAQKTGSGAAQ